MSTKLPHPRLVYRDSPEKVSPKQCNVLEHLLREVKHSKNRK